ncbi:PhzF family phenazine biosynthesis protein [Arthrobacter sp. B3I9]|uniref:PhzF family phenazine biosynthesis protein n=1 Tax=Arthrobacter sp. B3I9 TaxID=3042270 RepID=UPI0027950467|nr:PhzF family phenazine biosynthesis isomerase [Arthrobacter sp. B3I9]MDQ0849950.1 PhzF family phenazine biosynthesis protein [Arthrobacter sp. B3I9]
MENFPEVLRYAAFATTPDGGNPAGLVLDARHLDDAGMLAVAAAVGYAETAFVTEQGVDGDPRRSRVRYFSPIAEVPFCGHATIALAVALSERVGAGAFTFDTPVGPVVIQTSGEGADIAASFTAVEPRLAGFDDAVLAELLGLLGVGQGDLDPAYPPRISYSGNWHPVLVLADPTLFDSLSFDPDAVRRLMDVQGWTATVTVLHRTADGEFEARNLFPVGAITEDPATGAAAAAVGAYLRILGLVEPPARILIRQGRHVGRPGLLTVDIPPAGGIAVSGTAVRIPAPPSAADHTPVREG